MPEPEELKPVADSPQTDLDEASNLPAISQTGLESAAPEEEKSPSILEPEAPNRVRIDHRTYIKPEEHYVKIDGTSGVTSQSDKAESDLLDIVESLKGNRILTDKLHGVERGSADGEPFAVLNHGIFKIVIPASEMIDLPPDLNGRSPNELYFMLLHRRMGAEIDYIVKGISPDDTVAAASRKEAMAARRKRYFYGKDRDGNNLLYEDACAEVRVVCTYGGGIVVDLFGLETYIPLRELSWQRISRATEKFSPGDRIIVRIQELDRSDRNNIMVKTSVRLAMKDPYEDAMRKYTIGSCYTGIVSRIDTTGVFVAMDGGIDCLCTFPARGRPPVGSRVSVYIVGKNEETHRMWGAIIHAALPVID